MKIIVRLSLKLIVLATLLPACASGGNGPQTWIDQPLDGTNFSLDSAITIQAHAADDEGVARFEFSIDDLVLNTVNADGARLSDAAIEWTPPEVGPYVIKVRAFDGQGNPGPYAIKQINVLGMQAFIELPPEEQLFLEPPEQAVAESASSYFVSIDNVECGEGGVVYVDISMGNPSGIRGYLLFSTVLDAHTEERFTAPYPTFIEKRVQLLEPTDTIERSHEIGLEAEFAPGVGEASYAFEPDGRCPGHWEPSLAEGELKLPWITAKQNSNCRAGTSSQFEVVGFLLAEESASIEARDDLNDWVLITAPDTGKACWIAASLGDIEGVLDDVAIVATPVPPLPTATIQGAPPDPNQLPPDSNNPPPAGPDTTPPVIQSANVSPASILTPGGGCSSSPRTATVTVVAMDPGGIAHATVFWNLAGDSGQATLTFIGGDTWQGEAGPVSKTGTLNLFVNVEDNAGNDVLSGVLTVQVQSCIN